MIPNDIDIETGRLHEIANGLANARKASVSAVAVGSRLRAALSITTRNTRPCQSVKAALMEDFNHEKHDT